MQGKKEKIIIKGTTPPIMGFDKIAKWSIFSPVPCVCDRARGKKAVIKGYVTTSRGRCDIVSRARRLSHALKTLLFGSFVFLVKCAYYIGHQFVFLVNPY
jgi:hypothetical protein